MQVLNVIVEPVVTIVPAVYSKVLVDEATPKLTLPETVIVPDVLKIRFMLTVVDAPPLQIRVPVIMIVPRPSTDEPDVVRLPVTLIL